MGVLGWTEQQTLDTTIPAIELAYNARTRFLADIVGAIFGKGEPEPKPKAPDAPKQADVQSLLRKWAG